MPNLRTGTTVPVLGLINLILLILLSLGAVDGDFRRKGPLAEEWCSLGPREQHEEPRALIPNGIQGKLTIYPALQDLT